MRSFPVFCALLVLLAGGMPCQAQSAADLFDEDSFNPITFDPYERVDGFMNAPNPSDHAGLLGKVYMQERYLQLGIDDPNVRQLDKSLQGFDSFLNLPLMTLDVSTQLDFDLFFGYSQLGLKGSVDTGPPLDLLVAVDGRSETFSVGTTVYLTQAEHWRPFVQIGAEFSRSDTHFTITDGVNTFADRFENRQTDLLLTAGFEFDLFDVLGYRMTVDFETRDRFRDSTIANELILWPHEKVFIRGGLVTSLEGGGIGFGVGGGLAF